MFRGTIGVTADREWILTNGLGGYALGFGNMLNKRKYNGLLISSDSKFKRMNICSAIEEKVEYGDTSFFLDSNHYPNCIYPSGADHIVRSWLRPFPAVLYSTNPADENHLVLKEIFMLQKQNAVAVKYTNHSTDSIRLVLRPKFAMRDHHFVNEPGLWDRVHLEKEIIDNCVRIRRPDNNCVAFVYCNDAEFISSNLIYRSTYYPFEAVRGYDSVEDLVSPIRIEFILLPGESKYLVVSCDMMTNYVESAKKAEVFYKSYPMPISYPASWDSNTAMNCSNYQGDEFDLPGYRRILELAARDFIVSEDDIIAGYPWFGPWGRDTMISLEGLKCLEKGGQTALKILKKYGAQIKGGLLPNTFGEGGEGLNYDTIDAPLWYVLRCFEYGPADRELVDYASKIVMSYMDEEHHPFFVADDGLLEIREGSYALTWMDAKIYDNPVTPRHGKPIEINALWFNALSCLNQMAQINGIKEFSMNGFRFSTDRLAKLVEKVRVSMQEFVTGGYLADRIEKGEKIEDVRPNAVIALSLPFDFVGPDVMARVWQMAKEQLLTSYGLRSLSYQHSAFKQKYVGNQKQRDLSYHQGTVWAYLLLPFAKLAMKVMGSDISRLRKELVDYIWVLRKEFMKSEIASVAEVWDGIDPYFPKGCPAQAWSVFALLTIEEMIGNLRGVGR